MKAKTIIIALFVLLPNITMADIKLKKAPYSPEGLFLLIY